MAERLNIDRPLPTPGPLTAPFWDGCRRGELLFTRCGQCDTVAFPPRARCGFCSASAFVWERSAGHGSLYSWAIVARPPTPAFSVPFVIGIVGLDEGFQMVSNIVGINDDQLEIGTPLTVTFAEVGPETSIPVFVRSAF